MRFVHLVRLATVAIGAGYGCDSLQHGWMYWVAAHFGIANASFGRGYASSISAEQIGSYVTALAAVLIVFFAVPRFRWGVRALSWCFLIMGAFLLSNLRECFWSRVDDPSFVMQIECFGRELSFASPALVLGLILRYRFVEEELRPPNGPNVITA
jgi:hypothetical protein